MLATRAAKTFFRKTQKGRVHHFPGTTEAGSRPLLSQPSPTPQRAAPRHADILWHWPPEALPCWMGGFACPAAHLAPETLPCRTLTTPLPTVPSPGPADRDSGTRVCYPPWMAVGVCVCVCVCEMFPLGCQSVSRILMPVDVLL